MGYAGATTGVMPQSVKKCNILQDAVYVIILSRCDTNLCGSRL
jgi:hypothetical protein